jgi:hypothetical protein
LQVLRALLVQVLDYRSASVGVEIAGVDIAGVTIVGVALQVLSLQVLILHELFLHELPYQLVHIAAITYLLQLSTISYYLLQL